MTKNSSNKALIFIFITMLIDVIGIGIIIPVLPRLISNLIQGDLSVAARWLGILTFAYSAMQFIFSPILGALSDQYGRRPVLLTSLFGFGLDYILLGLAPTIGWLFIGRVISGITGASFTTAGAYIADISPAEKRAQNFGLIGAAFGLGFILGPIIGGYLVRYGTKVPFFFAAGLSLINWIYGYFFLPESLPVENRRAFSWERANPINILKNLNRYPIVAAAVLPLMLIYVAGYANQSTWTFYTMERFGWDEHMVGLSFGFIGLMAIIVQGGLTRVLLPKLGEKRAIYWGLACYALSFMLYALAPEGWMMFPITAIGALGGLSMPAIQGIISNQVPVNEQGELRGSLTSLMSLASLIGPLLMTYLFSYFTDKSNPIHLPQAPFWLAFVLALGSFFAVRPILSNFGVKSNKDA